jgi:hypothetical protein
MATNEAGTALVTLGRKTTIAIVKATKPSIINIDYLITKHSIYDCFELLQLRHKIIIAKPFTKPNITGCGTSLMNLPSLNKPIKN